MEVLAPVHAHAFSAVTEAEYLAIDGASERKYELIGGRLYAMAGALPVHNLISANIVAALRRLLRGTPCLPFGSDQRINIGANGDYVYPDVSVICRPYTRHETDKTTFVAPTLVCEVLSPSTRELDLSVKRETYQALPGLKEMLFVWPEPRTVEHYRRVADDQWLMTRVIGRAEVSLEAFGVVLPLDEIYADVEALIEP